MFRHRRSSAPETLLAPAPLWLVPTVGPEIEPLMLGIKSLAAPEQPLILGRHASADLRLEGIDQVSRRHASFRWDNFHRRWLARDLGSTWGTAVNGQALRDNAEVPIAVGDLIRVTPWTFLVAREPKPQGREIANDTGESASGTPTLNIRTVTPDDIPGLRLDAIKLLLEATNTLQDAADESELAQRLIEAAVEATGLPNAAVLRPTDTGSRYEVVASVGIDEVTASDDGQLPFSRTLLDGARTGDVTEVLEREAGETPISKSIGDLEITRAVCVPLSVGASVRLLLYLDRRRDAQVTQTPTDARDATSFCTAFAKIASMALANLNRLEMERRSAEYEADLSAAAEAQRWILPNSETRVGGFCVLGESRPGRGVGGDFFDVMHLPDGRVAAALGDVSGKGVGAGMLMTATQCFLHAALVGGSSPNDEGLSDVLQRLNGFVHPRSPVSRFITMWVGIFDPEAQTLTYVDAGHGFAFLLRGEPSGELIQLDEAGGPPVGVAEKFDYTEVTTPFCPGDAAIVMSDGIVEQPNDSLIGHGDQFGLSRIEAIIRSPHANVVQQLFDAVDAHAGNKQLADDATILLVRHDDTSDA
ncbi:MAG: SpoIIE family protein phosphatase [Planctomycetota bacterium]